MKQKQRYKATQKDKKRKQNYSLANERNVHQRFFLTTAGQLDALYEILKSDTHLHSIKSDMSLFIYWVLLYVVTFSADERKEERKKRERAKMQKGENENKKL